MAESERGLDQFSSFNDFFTRSLKPGSRPLADAATEVLSPADGAVSQLGTIKQGRIFQAKGQSYTATELLGGDAALAAKFDGGSFMTIYLSPSDYHRVHMPVGGSLNSTAYIPGELFSVNTVTAENVPRLFSRNERLSCVFDTDHGSVASVMVGAMIVASIETVWSGLVTPHRKSIDIQQFGGAAGPAPKLAAGAEMGRFLLGSTVVLLFEPGKVHWSPELKAGHTLRMGQSIGTFAD
ncbi:archaetidylserine decarboxylase [Pontixanthobacter gangjinensis]|nr:archaetidylserine decarboxylase [Pontixanthobacter gangjinensis]